MASRLMKAPGSGTVPLLLLLLRNQVCMPWAA